MRRLLPVLLLLASCSASPSSTPSTGTPRTEPEVLAAGVERHDFSQTPATTTTTAPPPTTAAPTTTAAPEAQVSPVTAAPPVHYSGSCGGWEGLVAAYFPASEVARGCQILMCESQGNPNAVSPTNDHGLWQINIVHRDSFDWSRRYDPDVNTAFAYRLWSEQGWSPWTCAK